MENQLEQLKKLGFSDSFIDVIKNEAGFPVPDFGDPLPSDEGAPVGFSRDLNSIVIEKTAKPHSVIFHNL